MPPKKKPIRLILRISTTGQRHTIPPDLITLQSTLSHIVSLIDLPISSNASLVCLRKVSMCDAWETTTLKDMLDGDDASAGVLMTLDLGSNSNATGGGNTGKMAIEKAAVSLNIKAEPMDISTQNVQSIIPGAPSQQKPTPHSAWQAVLSSNFDTASKSCMLTLLKIIDNILSRPDPKVRSIRYANTNFQNKVASCNGAVNFMYCLGFVANYPAFGNSEPESLELKHEDREILLNGRDVLMHSALKDFGMEKEELPKLPIMTVAVKATQTAIADSARSSNSTQGFNIYKGHSINVTAQQMNAPDPYANKSLSTTERTLQTLTDKKKRMESKFQSVMDRCLVAYLPGDGPTTSASNMTSSGEGKGDSSLVAARMKRMEEERKKREEGGFTTKAMRDLERMKKAKVYSHAQIRINFPDGTHLHAKFLPTENICTIRNIIKSSFITNCQTDFELYVAPPRRLLNDTKTLQDEELVPAAKIHVSWKTKLENNMSTGGFLRPELFHITNNTATSFPEAKPILPEKKVTPNAITNSSGGGSHSQSKEEMLMARMMGKGLLGSKKKRSDGSGSEHDKTKDKPKWFQ